MPPLTLLVNMDTGEGTPPEQCGTCEDFPFYQGEDPNIHCGLFGGAVIGGKTSGFTDLTRCPACLSAQATAARLVEVPEGGMVVGARVKAVLLELLSFESGGGFDRQDTMLRMPLVARARDLRAALAADGVKLE
jgi:hypothetical protein